MPESNNKMDDVIVIEFDDDGNIICLDDADIADVLEMLGIKQTRRASHVVPCEPLLKCLFRFIRQRVDDKSLLAEFTRLWPCAWEADMAPSGGPVLGPFPSRRQALKKERRWLIDNVFHLQE